MVEKRFNQLGIPDIERFENYLPTAFSSELTLLQKVNKIIQDLIRNFDLTNEMVDYLNNFIETFDENLYETVDDILNEWLKNDKLAKFIRDLINEEVIEARTDYLGRKYVNLKERLDSEKADIVEVTNQLAHKANKDEVTNIMTPKGNKLYNSLPTTGNTIGDYYYCPDGDGVNGAGNYVWNGTAWYFGGTGDEGYNKLKEDLNESMTEISENVNIFSNVENIPVHWNTGKRIDADGSLVNEVGDGANQYMYTDLIPVDIFDKYFFTARDWYFGSNIEWLKMFNFYSQNIFSEDYLVARTNPPEATSLTVMNFNASKIVVPMGAKYVSICCIKRTPTSVFDFDLFGQTIPIEDGAVTSLKLENVKYVENIISNFEKGVINSDGIITYSSTYKITDLMEVESNVRYYRRNSTAIALVGLYDKSQNWIGRKEMGVGVDFYDIPSNVKYVRLCDSNSDMENQVFARYKTSEFVDYGTKKDVYLKDNECFAKILSIINDEIAKVEAFSHYYKLKGKKVVLMGDSISYGVGASDRNTTSWARIFERITGCSLTNLSISGASIQYRANAESTSKSLYTLSSETNYSNYDVCIISAGTNDILGNIGNVEDAPSQNTACSALKSVINNVTTSNPNIKIVYFTPMFRSRFSSGDGLNSDDNAWEGKYVYDLADKLESVAKLCHVPCKNLYRQFLLGKYNADLLLADGLHPNDLGHERIASVITDFVEHNI